MRAAILLACAVLTATTACDRGPSPPAADPGATIDTVTDAGASEAVEVPAELLASVQRGAPENVVRLLLQWDTAGRRFEGPYADALNGLYCYLPELQCLSEEPAWDFVLAVDGYQLDEVYATADSAQYVVIFDELGMLWPDGMEEPKGTPPETLSLRRLAGSWRITGVGSQMPPHLSPGGVLRRYRGVHPDSAVLARWLRERQ